MFLSACSIVDAPLTELPDTIICIIISDCSITNSPLTELPYPGGTLMNIYHDMIFKCYGKVFQWQFFARRTGTVFVDVWRLVTNNKIRLIGKNRVVVNVNNYVMVIVMFCVTASLFIMLIRLC